MRFILKVQRLSNSYIFDCTWIVVLTWLSRYLFLVTAVMLDLGLCLQSVTLCWGKCSYSSGVNVPQPLRICGWIISPAFQQGESFFSLIWISCSLNQNWCKICKKNHTSPSATFTASFFFFFLRLIFSLTTFPVCVHIKSKSNFTVDDKNAKHRK